MGHPVSAYVIYGWSSTSVDMRLHLRELERQEEEEDAAAEAGAECKGQRRGGQHHHFLSAANASAAWGYGECNNNGNIRYCDNF